MISNFTGENNMNRVDIIQALINTKKAKNYLEIGFGYGDCFLNISAPNKIVVEPKFVFFKKRILKYFYRNFMKNILNKYYKMTSNVFFQDIAPKIYKNKTPDIIFIDGLHVYKQTLNDSLNALKFINNDGIIILHDCNPKSETAAYPTASYGEAASLNLPNWDGYWSGDVWKTIVYLRSMHPDLYVFVLDCDMGIGVICKNNNGRSEKLNYTTEDIDRLIYKDLKNSREHTLNLKPPEFLYDFLKSI